MADARQATQEFIDAFNSHDERRIREGYADNAVFEAPGGVGGKVTEERLYFDQLEFLMQLGVIEQPQEASALS